MIYISRAIPITALSANRYCFHTLMSDRSFIGTSFRYPPAPQSYLQ
ncbi:hypothetical protein FORC065_1796 [Yersinia enterocolitica]|nr:hypothetical protein FORC065_1796 [Yersinia enterocolitica]